MFFNLMGSLWDVNGEGVDPKSILCEFFKVGQCTKGFKCKFSHDLNVQRKGEKIDIYSDKRDQGELVLAIVCFLFCIPGFIDSKKQASVWFFKKRWRTGTRRRWRRSWSRRTKSTIKINQLISYVTLSLSYNEEMLSFRILRF